MMGLYLGLSIAPVGRFGGPLTYAINADANDGQELPDVGLYTTAINAGDASGLEAIAFWHLTGLAIDQGAIIDSATFTATATTGVTGTGTITLKAQKVADASLPANPGNLPSAMTLTTASVTIPLGVGVKTLDVTAIIQELVNQGAWASGNDINLIALDETYTTGHTSNLAFADYPTAGFGSLEIDVASMPAGTLTTEGGLGLTDEAGNWITGE